MSGLGLTAVPVIALVLTLGVFVLLLPIIWSMKRRRDLDLHIECNSQLLREPPIPFQRAPAGASIVFFPAGRGLALALIQVS